MLRFVFEVACRLWRWLRSIGAARPVILRRPAVFFLETVPMARAKFKAIVGEVVGINIVTYQLVVRKASDGSEVLRTNAPESGGWVEFVVPLLPDEQYEAYTLAVDEDGDAGESPLTLFSTPANTIPAIADAPTIEFIGFVADEE